MGVKLGLDQLKKLPAENYPGNIALLCHSASIDSNINHALSLFESKFGERWSKIFSPQHGLVSDVQDNMVETPHTNHPYFKRPIYSLYSETREPTDEMLKDIDTVFIDLQDVGCRIYTYIYSMTLMMKRCAQKGIKVVVLDRPNPIDGLTLEGNMLDLKFKSFVGLHELPVRHGMTIGEIALMANKLWQDSCELEIIEMDGWKRSMIFSETQIPWVLPSPNLATPEAAFPFVGTVIFEGTNISEGRGTTRSLEFIGHPALEPFKFLESIQNQIKDLEGFVLRPIQFLPTFQKHAGKSCGGFQIHVTDPKTFRPWKLNQILCRELYHHLGDHFQWKQPPYEYEYEKPPIDMINGTDKLRLWIESNGKNEELDQIEKAHKFSSTREPFLIYS